MELYLHRKEWLGTRKGRLYDWVAGTIIISIAAQLGTLPLTMYYFGQISNYFLLTNLIVLPLATFLVPFGLLTVALGGSWLGLIVSKATWALAWAMNHSVEWIEHLPGSLTHVSVSWTMVMVYYLLFCGLCICIYQKKAVSLQSQLKTTINTNKQ